MASGRAGCSWSTDVAATVAVMGLALLCIHRAPALCRNVRSWPGNCGGGVPRQRCGVDRRQRVEGWCREAIVAAPHSRRLLIGLGFMVLLCERVRGAGPAVARASGVDGSS